MTDHERSVAYWRAFKAALPPTTIEAIAAEVGARLGTKLAYATTENAIRRVIDPDDPTAKDRTNQKVPASELDAVLREVLGGHTDEIVARACRAAAAAVVVAVEGAAARVELLAEGRGRWRVMLGNERAGSLIFVEGCREAGEPDRYGMTIDAGPLGTHHHRPECGIVQQGATGARGTARENMRLWFGYHIESVEGLERLTEGK